MITIAQYYMGRDQAYAKELTPQKHLNAANTVQRVNALIAAYEADGGVLYDHPVNKSNVSSGWRPQRVNASTAGAAPMSNHMLCAACDIYDPDGHFDEWALDHPEVLEKIGLWQEHPSATKGWLHVQITPPRSGKRVFYP